MKKTLSVFLAVILVLSVSLTVFAGDRTYAGDETYYNKTADNTLLTKQASYDFSSMPTGFGGITATGKDVKDDAVTADLLYYNNDSSGYLFFDGNIATGNVNVTTSALTAEKLSNFYMTFGFKSIGGWNKSAVRFGVSDDGSYYALRFRSSSFTTDNNEIALVKKTANTSEVTVAKVTTNSNLQDTDFAVKLFVNGTYVTAEVTDGTNTYPLFATLDNRAGDIKLYVYGADAGFSDINIYEYTGVVCDNDKLKEVDCNFDSDMGVIEEDEKSTADNGMTLDNGKLIFNGKNVKTKNGKAITKAIGGNYTDFAVEFDISNFQVWASAYICFGGTAYDNGYSVKMTAYGSGEITKGYNTVMLGKNIVGSANALSLNEFRGDTNQNKIQESGNYHVAMTVRNKQLQLVFTSTDKKTAVMPIIYDLTDYTGGNIFLYVYGSQSVSVDNLNIYDLSDEAMLKAFDNQKGYVNRYGFDSADVVPSTGITNGSQPTVSFGALKYSSTKVDNSTGSDANKTYSENLNGEGKNWSDFYCSFDYTHGRKTWGITEFNFRQRIEDNKNTSAFKYKIRFDACAKDSNNSVISNQLNISLIESHYTRDEEKRLGTKSYNFGDLTNQVCHVEISAVGNKIIVFIDGEEIFNVTDDTYTSGATMIYTQDSAATLDNFFLYNYAKDGDLDESNEVDILDLVLLNKNATLKNSLYADVDNNGTANEDADFTALRNIILGK